MPHVMRGTHTFRLLEQTHGAIANTSLAGLSSNNAAAAEMGPPALHTDNDPQSSDDEFAIPPTTPVCLSSISTTVSKCKRSMTILQPHTANGHTVLPLVVQQCCMASEI